jgi:voltage-gated potassium channel
MRKFYYTYLKFPLLVRVSLILWLILFISAVMAHLFEPKTFPTIFEGIYWAVITAGTVGYGDFVPHTIAGRILSIFLVLLGGAFLAFLTAHIASAVVKKESRYIEGKSMYKIENHIVIVGWNERSRHTILQLMNKVNTSQIVLIDSSLKKNPLYLEGVGFIHGKACEDQTWMKANVSKVKTVLITADANLKESDADMNTILSILTVRGLNSNVVINAEILTNEQTANAKRAGADFIIHTSNLAALQMVKSCEDSSEQ